MAKRRGQLKRRRWADVLVIVVGVYALIMAGYGGMLGRPAPVATRVDAPGWFAAALGMAGTCAIASVLVALRNTLLARVLCAAAGVLLLSTIFALESVDARAVVDLILPALALFVATPFLGAMPSPEEEGRRR
ncbi:MAG TPA: hypothetical protein VF212_04750 [Longimicrobiales bacterium]